VEWLEGRFSRVITEGNGPFGLATSGHPSWPYHSFALKSYWPPVGTFSWPLTYCGTVVKDLITRAKDVAEAELASMSGRLAHVNGVAATADKVAKSLMHDGRIEVVAAAWLHDVGYGPRVRESGFHPIDGAAFLRLQGFPDVVTSLVAFHSGAAEEADERGLAESLHRFTPPPIDLLDILTYADMMTGPAGQPVTVEVRIAEILDRYSSDDPVYRAVSRSATQLEAAVGRIEDQLESATRHPR
jgi:hypothetical protein